MTSLRDLVIGVLGKHAAGKHDQQSHAGERMTVSRSEAEGQLYQGEVVRARLWTPREWREAHDKSLPVSERQAAFSARDATNRAYRTRYSDRKTVRETLDEYIRQGFTKTKKRGTRTYLADGKGSELRLDGEVARDYARVALWRIERGDGWNETSGEGIGGGGG